jgi:hypothetical protein
MNIFSLFARLHSPEADLGGGGADLGSAEPSTPAADTGSEPAGPSIEDTIRDKYRELTGTSGEDDGEEGAEAPKEPKKPQARQNGRFAKEGAQAAAPGTEGDQQAPAGEEGEGEQPVVTQKPHDAMPNTWKKELSEEWKALPERARQEIHRREQDMFNGLRQYKEGAQFGQSMAREMLPYQRIMQEKGVTPQAIVRDIMGALNTMATGSEESKADTFLQLAKTYGINLDQVMTRHSRVPSQAVPGLEPVLQRVQQIESRFTQADQERQRQQDAEDDAAAQRFLNDPKNEHARTVAPQVAALLSSGQAKDYADAYEQAIWLHPEVRQKLLDKQAAEQRKKDSEQAKNARRAASTNVQRRGTPPAQTAPRTMDDTIREQLRKHNLS